LLTTLGRDALAALRRWKTTLCRVLTRRHNTSSTQFGITWHMHHWSRWHRLGMQSGPYPIQHTAALAYSSDVGIIIRNKRLRCLENAATPNVIFVSTKSGACSCTSHNLNLGQVNRDFVEFKLIYHRCKP
jgi:hypothetical protein